MVVALVVVVASDVVSDVGAVSSVVALGSIVIPKNSNGHITIGAGTIRPGTIRPSKPTSSNIHNVVAILLVVGVSWWVWKRSP